MPDRVITKPPTAELKPNQTDQDTLPPYECWTRSWGAVEGESVDALVAEGTTAPRCCACGGCWTAPNTSAARRRRA